MTKADKIWICKLAYAIAFWTIYTIGNVSKQGTVFFIERLKEDLKTLEEE